MISVKHKVLEGNSVLGTWCILPSTHLIDVVGSTNLDFIILDREHGPFSYETIASIVPICENNGLSPLVRIPEVSQCEIQRALDAGAHGLHVPSIFEKEQIEALVEFAKYPPKGLRGLSPYTLANRYTSSNLGKKIAQANATTMLVVHLEGAQAIEKAETFFCYEEIDVFFIGLYDLSNSLGHNGNTHHPEVWQTLKSVVSLANQHNRCIGTIASSIEDLKRLQTLDIRYITYASDCHVIHTSYQEVVHQFNQQRICHGFQS